MGIPTLGLKIRKIASLSPDEENAMVMETIEKKQHLK
jgi:hypothetical protein